MATTATAKGQLNAGDFAFVVAVDLTTIAPGETVDASTAGICPRGTSPDWITWETRVEATSGDPVLCVEHIAASDVTTADSETVRLRVKAESGGDLTGATVRVFCWYLKAASGGNRAANA